MAVTLALHVSSYQLVIVILFTMITITMIIIGIGFDFKMLIYSSAAYDKSSNV